MKKILCVAMGSIFFIGASAQGLLDKINKAVKKDSGTSVISTVSKTIQGGAEKGNGLSKEEIIAGLKEALSVGTGNSTLKLGTADGFFKDAAIKILMPEEAKKAESTLRKFGMGSMVDKAILSMNRAAEDAATGVKDIFLNAIKGMTVSDGLKILNGGDFAATEYLKNNTSTELTEKMRPVIEASLAKVNATAYWKDVFTNYNKFSKEKVDTDLSSYVTTKAMNGIFYSIGLEEQKIRKDPGAQVSNLLKKVFGNK